VMYKIQAILLRLNPLRKRESPINVVSSTTRGKVHGENIVHRSQPTRFQSLELPLSCTSFGAVYIKFAANYNPREAPSTPTQ